MRRFLFVLSLFGASLLLAQPPPRPQRPGVKEAGVQRQMSVVTPVAVFPVEGTPDWQVLTEDSVWVANGPKNTIHRLDVKTNTVIAAIEVGKRPCSGLAAGFGSIWVPSCGDNTLSRVDIKTNRIVATLPYAPANSEGGLATSDDGVWMLTDKSGILSRIDPATNKLAAEIHVAAGSFACGLGEDGAIWISSTENNLISRVDPKTNVDYPRGTTYQPDEHGLELSRGDLLELYDALVQLNGKPDKIVMRDLTVVPRR